MAEWAHLAIANIQCYMQAGWCLRRCRRCQQWLLAKSKKKKLCRRPDCDRWADTEQKAASREGVRPSKDPEEMVRLERERVYREAAESRMLADWRVRAAIAARDRAPSLLNRHPPQNPHAH